jgi:uncharacterized protein YqeY
MSLAEKISADVKDALKSGDKSRLSILRMIKSSIKNKEIEKSEALTDEETSAILRSFLKRANESIEQFTIAGRTDLVEKEKEESEIIQNYLPRQLNEDQTKEIVSNAINEVGATGPGDMGKIMKAIMAKAGGQIDGKLASKLVKEMLEV